MTRYKDSIWCDGCGIEILWPPLFIGDFHYCCEDCLEGWPCACDERQEVDEERRRRAEAAQGAMEGTAA